MKFTLSWLNEYIELDNSVGIDELSRVLTDIGLEVESVEDNARKYADFSVAEILSTAKHPDADKLQICTVKTANDERIIVCGAANARAGIKVVLADIGCHIPNGGFKIKKSKIRGVESFGMLCSADELGLGEDSSGIMELDSDTVVGDNIASILGLGDVLIEIAITPNRGDCLGVYGIARDLAAAGLGTLKPLSVAKNSGEFSPDKNVTLKSEDCKHFTYRTFENITNDESPAWLQSRLKSVGLKPISALVDITNYIAHSFARPLHVYDNDKLSGDLQVRDSQAGESFSALNDKNYELTDGLCVISNESEAVLGLGGVIGGITTGCSANTVNIFLESAWFEPDGVAKTGRELQIDSDARYRFERIVDPETTLVGIEIATQMIVDICASDKTKISEIAIVGEQPSLTQKIDFSPDLVKNLGGMTVDNQEIKNTLERLGFGVDDAQKTWQVTSPSYRPDIKYAADLVEEVLRIKGYSAIKEQPLPPTTSDMTYNNDETLFRNVRRQLVSGGMSETYNFAFIEEAKALRFSPDNGESSLVEVINPISSEMSIMRTNLLPSMLDAIAKNTARDVSDIAFFEMGNIFLGADKDNQPIMTSGVLTGNKNPINWNLSQENFDVFDAKEKLFSVLSSLGIDVEKLKITTDAPSWYHPGKSARVSLGGKITLGYFGEIHPSINRVFDIKQDVAAFEIFLENIPNKKKKSAKSTAIKTSDFQATKRDFAFVVDIDTYANELLMAIKNSEKKLLKDVTLFDVYDGDNIENGKKSLAISVTLQAMDRTLVESDIAEISEAIILAAKSKGAELR